MGDDDRPKGVGVRNLPHRVQPLCIGGCEHRRAVRRRTGQAVVTKHRTGEVGRSRRRLDRQVGVALRCGLVLLKSRGVVGRDSKDVVVVGGIGRTVPDDAAIGEDVLVLARTGGVAKRHARSNRKVRLDLLCLLSGQSVREVNDFGDVAVPVLGLVERPADSEHFVGSSHHSRGATGHEAVAAEHTGAAIQLHLNVVQYVGSELDTIDLRLVGNRRSVLDVVHAVRVREICVVPLTAPKVGVAVGTSWRTCRRPTFW